MNRNLHIIASLLLAMLLLSGEAMAEGEQQDPTASEEFEMDAWTSAKDINTVEAYEIYLAEYAKGRHAKFAQAAINKIKKAENSKGGEEGNLLRTKDAAEAASKQPAVPVAPPEVPVASTTEPKAAAAGKQPAIPVAPSEAPVASATEAKAAATPASGNADSGKGESAPKP